MPSIKDDNIYIKSLNDSEKISLYKQLLMKTRMDTEILGCFRVSLERNKKELIYEFQDVYYLDNLLNSWYKIYKLLTISDINGYKLPKHPTYFWEQMNLYYEIFRHPREGMAVWDKEINVIDYFTKLERYGFALLDFFDNKISNVNYDISYEPKLKVTKAESWNNNDKLIQLIWFYKKYLKAFNVYIELGLSIDKDIKNGIFDNRLPPMFFDLSKNTTLFHSWYGIYKILNNGLFSIKINDVPDIKLYSEIINFFDTNRHFTNVVEFTENIDVITELQKIETWLLNIVEKNFKDEWNENFNKVKI